MVTDGSSYTESTLLQYVTLSSLWRIMNTLEQLSFNLEIYSKSIFSQNTLTENNKFEREMLELTAQ